MPCTSCLDHGFPAVFDAVPAFVMVKIVGLAIGNDQQQPGFNSAMRASTVALIGSPKPSRSGPDTNLVQVAGGFLCIVGVVILDPGG